MNTLWSEGIVKKYKETARQITWFAKGFNSVGMTNS